MDLVSACAFSTDFGMPGPSKSSAQSVSWLKRSNFAQMRRTIVAQKEVSGMPQIGDILTVRGLLCRVYKVWPFGTVDVLTLDGNKAFRVSGLYRVSTKGQ